MNKLAGLMILVLPLVASPGCKVSTESRTLLGSDPGKVKAEETVHEKFVDLPWTVADARAMHAPPGTKVTVERVTQEETAGQNANCGRAGLVCAAILLLPLPEAVNQIVVIESPDRVIQAVYTEGGDLERARVTAGREIQEVEVRSSVRLNRKLLVEIGRRTIAANGTEGELRETPILGQAPHLSELYRAALLEDQATVPKKDQILPQTPEYVAKNTCRDMRRVLGSDHGPLCRDFLQDPGLSDEAKAGIRTCLEE